MKPPGAALRPSSDMIGVCACLAAVVLVGAVFAPVLVAGFVNRDDLHYVFETGRIWSPTRYEVLATFERLHHPTETGGYYQPMTALSLMADAVLTGTSPARAFHFHLTNLALHLANVVLIFALVRRLSGGTTPAVLLALLFGVHPVQAAAVSSIAQRMTLLGAFFALLAIHAWLRTAEAPGWGRLTLATILYALAVMSHPAFLALPFALLLLDVWPLRRRPRRALLEKTPFFAVMLAGVGLHVWIQSGAGRMRPIDWDLPWLAALNVSSWLQRLAWPVGLSPINPLPQVETWSDASAWLHAALPAIPVAVMIFAWRRSRALFVALAGGFVMIIPALLHVPFAQRLLGDAHLYAAGFVPLAAAAAWVARRGAACSHGTRRAAVVGLCGGVVAFSFLSRSAAHAWRTGESLYERTIQRYPTWAAGYVGLIEWSMIAGDYATALDHARRAAEVAPADPLVQFYLGTTLLHQPGRSAEAVWPLRRALASDPNWVECLQNLGAALARSGRHEEAVEFLERARDLSPDSPGVRTALGHAYLKTGRPASARSELQTALKLRNDPVVHLGLAMAWAANDVPEYARMHLQAAVARDERFAALAAESSDLRRLAGRPGFESLIDPTGIAPTTNEADALRSPATPSARHRGSHRTIQ